MRMYMLNFFEMLLLSPHPANAVAYQNRVGVAALLLLAFVGRGAVVCCC